MWYVGDVDSIVAEVRRFMAGGQRASEADDPVTALSRREIEIAVLLAERLSTPEIADRLFISPKTVSKHLEHIYLKLRVSTRGGAREVLLAGNRTVVRDPFG